MVRILFQSQVNLDPALVQALDPALVLALDPALALALVPARVQDLVQDQDQDQGYRVIVQRTARVRHGKHAISISTIRYVLK